MIRRLLAAGLLAALLSAPAAPAQDDLARAVQETYLTNLAMLSEAAESAVGEMFLNFGAPAGSTVLLEAENNHEARWFVESLLLERLTERGYRVYLKGGLERPRDRAAAGGAPGGGAPAGGSPGADTPSLATLLQGEPGGDTSADTPADTADTAVAADGEPASPGASPGSGEPVPSIGQVAGTGPASPAQPEADYIFRFRVAECSLVYPRSYRKSPLGSRTVQRLATVSLFGTLVSGEHEDVVWVGRGDSERLDHVPAGKLPLLEGNSYPFTQPALESRGLGAYVEPVLVLSIVLGLVYLFYTNQ